MKINNREAVWEGTYLRAVLLNYVPGKDNHGSTAHTWEAFERVNCSGIVCVVPFTENNEVVLIRQFRPPVNGHVVELPAGLAEVGESLEDAARRELTEETGYRAKSLKFLIRGPMSSGASSEMLDVFVADRLEYVGVGQRDETEFIEVLTVPVRSLAKELDALVQRGDMVDLKVYGLVELARNGSGS